MSFIQRPVAIKAFEREGIRIWADEARTQFRSVIDIFAEVAARWPQMGEATRDMFVQAAEQAGLYSEELAELAGVQKEFNDLQQRDISQAMAGIYRRNYILALLQNWAKIDQVLISMEDSLGYSMRENARTTQTLEKRYKALKAAAQELAVALGDAGLLDQLKFLTDGAKTAITWFNELPAALRILVIQFGIMTAVLNTFNLVLKMAGGKNMAEFALNAAGLVGLLKNIRVGLLGVFGGPWGLAITTTVAAISTLVSYLHKTEQEARDTAKSVTELYQQYEKLADQLENLRGGHERATQIQTEMQAKLDAIADVAPDVVEAYGDMGHVLKLNTEELQKYLDLHRRVEAAQKVTVDTITSLKNELQETVAARQREIDRLEREAALLPDLVRRRNEVARALQANRYAAEEAEEKKQYLADLERAIIDIVGEEGMARLELAKFTKQSVDEQVRELERLIAAERRATLIAFSETQTRLRQQKLEAQARLESALKEQQNLEQLMEAPKPPEGGGFWDWFSFAGSAMGYSEAMSAGAWAQWEKLRQRRQQDIQQAREALREIERAESDLQKQIQAFLEEPRPTAEELLGYAGAPEAAEKAGRSVDRIRERLQALADVLEELDLINRQYEADLARTTDRLSLAAAEYDYLAAKIEAGTATVQDYARAQDLVSVKIALLEQEQTQLGAANEKYRRDLATLNAVLAEAARQYEAFKAAGDVEHMRDAAQVVSQLQDKIQSLSSAIEQNSAKWWENQAAIEAARLSVYEGYYQRLTDWMQHMANIGQLTVQQQLEMLKQVDLQRLSEEQRRRTLEQNYRYYRDLLNEEVAALREAYDERLRQIEAEEEATEKLIEKKEQRIEAIERETAAEIEAIQALIDALDVKDEQAGREEAERQHNKKLADLREEYQYHSLRSGLEHQRRMAEILEEIAEEEHQWELQKQEWARQDQREAYQQQIEALREQAQARQDALRQEIDDLREANEKKRKEIEDYYDDIQRLLDEERLDMLASLALTNEEVFDRGVELIRRYTAGIAEGKRRYLPADLLEDFFGEVEEEKRRQPTPEFEEEEPVEPVAVFTDYKQRDGRTYAWARDIGRELGLPVDWNAQTGMVTIGGRTFSPDFVENNKAYLSLRRVGEALGYIVEYVDGIVQYLPKAHIGAYVTRTGIAELLQGERVLSPRLTVSFDRLANALANFPNIPERIALTGRTLTAVEMERIANGVTNRLIAVLERKGIQIDKLLNVETAEFADRTDMEVLSRELGRLVNMLQTARG